MIAKKTNTPAILNSVAVLQSDTAMRGFIAVVKAWRGQTIQLVCSAANYLLVSCYLVADEKSRHSVQDAMDEMRKQVKNAAGIKGDMLNIYTTRAKSLFQVLTEGNKYPAIVQELAKFANTAEGAQKATEHLSAYMEINWNVASLRQLSAFLGYRLPVNRTGTGGADKTPSQKVQTSLVNAIKAATKASVEAKLPASVEAKAIANTVPDPLLLAREAIKRYASTDAADPTDLMDLVTAINTMIDAVTARAEAKAKDAKEAAKAGIEQQPPGKRDRKGAKSGKETRASQS